MRNWKAWLGAGGVSSLVAGMILLGGGDPEVAPVKFNEMSKVAQDSVARAEYKSAEVGESIMAMRTKNMDVVKRKNGKREAKIYSQDRHYLDSADGYYKEKNLSVKEIHADAKDNPERLFDKYVDAGSYKITWFSGNKKDFTFHKDDHSVEYTTLHNTTDITTVIEQQYNGVKETITLHNAAADTILKWLITSNANYQQEGNAIIFDDSGGYLFHIEEPTAFDFTGVSIPITVSLAGDTLSYEVHVPLNAVYPIEVDPVTTIGESNPDTGVMERSNATYTTARNATTSQTVSAGGSTIGQRGLAGTEYIFRQALTFDTSSLAGSLIDAAEIKMVVQVDDSDTEFNLQLVEGTYDASGGDLATSWYNDFVGWVSSGAYSLTDLAPEITTVGISNGDTLLFTLNGTGLTKISTSGFSKFMIISDEDAASSAPSNSEFVVFEPTTQYIRVWYSPVEVKGPTNLLTFPALSTAANAYSIVGLLISFFGILNS